MRTSHASVPPFLPAALSCDACRYLISNCKDQSIKLWDLRHCLVSDRQAREFAERPDIPAFRWDYRSVTIRGGGALGIGLWGGHELWTAGKWYLVHAPDLPIHDDAMWWGSKVVGWDGPDERDGARCVLGILNPPSLISSLPSPSYPPIRWMQYPGCGYAIKHPKDGSIATFRGHEVGVDCEFVCGMAGVQGW